MDERFFTVINSKGDRLEAVTDDWVMEHYPEDGPAMLLEAGKRDAVAAVDRNFGAMLSNMLGDPPRAERETWNAQRTWAEHFKKDGKNKKNLEDLATPEETAAIKQLGGDVADTMADKVLQKADAADGLIGKAAGLRRRFIKAIEGAADLADLSEALAQAEKQALAAIETIKKGG